MPNVDGHSVVRYLRRFGMQVPAIAVTGLDTADDRYKSAQAGFDLHLAKPVTPDIVVRAILDVLGRP
jgi:CheY-like chemotaxis protein